MPAASAASASVAYTGGTGTLNAPAGLTNGDWLQLTCIADTAGDTPTLNGSTPVALGWSLIVNQTINTNDGQLFYVWTKVASGEPSSWTAATGAADAIWKVDRITGSTGLGATPVYTAGTGGDQGTTVVLGSPGITAAQAGSLIYWLGSADHGLAGASSASGPTSPGTWNQDPATPANVWCNLAGANQIFASAGATGAINGSATVEAGSPGQQSQTVVLEWVSAVVVGTSIAWLRA